MNCCLVTKFRLYEQSPDSLDVLDLQLELPIHPIRQQDAKGVQVLPGKGEWMVLHVASMCHEKVVEIQLQVK